MTEPMKTDDYSRYFKILSEVSKSIHSGTSTGEVLERIVGHISNILDAKGCIFWIINTGKRTIETMISHGFTYRSLAQVEYDTLIKIFNPEEGNGVFIEDARADERIPDLERLGKQRVGSITGLFFTIVGSYTGILAVYFTNYRKLDTREMELITALGEQGTIALHKTLTYDDQMLQTLKQIVEGFVLALEAKDEQTHGHSIRVADFARLTAVEMGLKDKEVETIHHAGLLHDIGKIGMEDYILERLGILTGKEMDIVKKHPVIGARIVKPLTFLQDVEPLILYHHERYDGSGYPEGLKGEKIPMGARILSVCDAFETMLSGRNHMEKMTFHDAIVNLQRGININFDPKVVKALFSVLQNHPEVVDAQGATDRCMEQMQLDIEAIGVKNLIRKNMRSELLISF
ncbi:MAG: HD domain-containing phosphohydrolase [Pseudomonadota bacterium]